MRKPVSILLSGLLSLSVLALGPDRAFAQDAGLTGKWLLNEDRSDDPGAQFQQAMGAGGRSDNPGQPPGGGRGGNRGSRGGAGRGQGQQSIQRLMETSNALRIVHDDSTVTIVGAEGMMLVLYPDGREINYPVEGVGNVETRARWTGEKLIVERTVENGPRVTTSYETASNGQEMLVTVHMEGGRSQEPIEIRRVYDLAQAD